MDIVFVNVQTPRDALQLAKEPEFRSHVARHQWKHSARRDKRRRRAMLSHGSHEMKNSEYPTGLVINPCSSDPVSISPQIGGLRVDPFKSYPVSAQPWTALGKCEVGIQKEPGLKRAFDLDFRCLSCVHLRISFALFASYNITVGATNIRSSLCEPQLAKASVLVAYV